MLAKVVERQNLSVDTARDGVEAIERIDEDGYSVILLDLMMPRVDGFQFLERLDGVRRGGSPVIIVMTAFDAAPLRKLGARSVHAVVHKPFDVEQVVEIVRDCALLHPSARKANRGRAQGARTSPSSLGKSAEEPS